MYTNRLAAALINVSGIILLPWVSTFAQQTAIAAVQERTILFVCEHGSAKSVIATAHFNDLAAKNGLPYRAIARGVHPDKEIPPYIMSGLAAERLDIRGWQPKRFSEDDALRSDRIITLGCALPAAKSIVMRKREEWNDVPSPSENYQNASHAVAERVALLVRDLTSK